MNEDETIEGNRYEPLVAFPNAPICVMTRFRARSPFGLLAFYRLYGQVRRANKGIDGLLTTSFLMQDWRTCVTFSLWESEEAILNFNLGHEHVTAANMSFSLVEWVRSKPAIWSGQFRLEGVSRANHEWDELAFLLHSRG